MARKMKFPRSSGTKPSPKKAKHLRHSAAEFAAAEPNPANSEQIAQFRNRITTFLNKANGRPLSKPDLTAKCRGKGKPAYMQALRRMLLEGDVAERRNGYVLSAQAGMKKAVISRQSRSYGYAQTDGDKTEYFIPGREMKGAMLGDRVLILPVIGQGNTPEAEVVTVIKAEIVQTAGLLIEEDGVVMFRADQISTRPLAIENAAEWKGHAGEKVIGRVVIRGKRHSEHVVHVDTSLGSADSARVCAEAIVIVSGVPTEFPPDVLADAAALEEKGISEDDLNGRLDLRNPEDIIFTIDGFDAKDLDDAVSISRTETGYRLGVHIADVSHYVTLDSALDREAIKRGTSIYYADQVIPMLPKALSNGICSLHPGVDRLAFSALMHLDANGGLIDWEFRKTVIRSRVKGVYREVNAVLDGTADAEIEAKYAPVKESLLLLNELREKRLAARKKRGAPDIEAEESAFLLDENGVCTDIFPRNRGCGEELIEECMLLANEAAARLAKTQHLPFVYRVHAQPPADKSIRLTESLDRLCIKHPQLDSPKPKDYAQVLQNAAESPMKNAIHQMVLRSMAKADYETEPVGHFGLALADYSHFTSPIRRYPDLAIHRILTAYLSGESPKELRSFASDAADAGTLTEQRAVKLERECDDCYRAEWAKQHLGEVFEGMISGVTEFGIYVMLPNTAEGMVSLEALPVDEYEYDGLFTMKAYNSGKKYTIGDPMTVSIDRADISSGHIDFSLAGE